SHWETLVSGVRGVFVVASGLPSPVTDARELAHQNHWGSVSSASPSPYAGVDPLCARTTPTRAEGRRPLRLFVCQATNGGGEMSVRLVLTKSQQGRTKLLLPKYLAGLFFAFSVAVMQALARLPAAGGIAAMQSINIAILNPLFLSVFL